MTNSFDSISYRTKIRWTKLTKFRLDDENFCPSNFLSIMLIQKSDTNLTILSRIRIGDEHNGNVINWKHQVYITTSQSVLISNFKTLQLSSMNLICNTSWNCRKMIKCQGIHILLNTGNANLYGHAVFAGRSVVLMSFWSISKILLVLNKTLCMDPR